jgi:hypothetical protein
MQEVRSGFMVKLILLLTLPLALLACSNGSGGFPQIASPPPFDYADGAELRSGMHRLAYASQRLDLALLSSDSRDESSRMVITDSLRDIERISNEIERGDISSNHRFLRADMENFQSMVRRAIREAEGNPPNYAAAGRVSGSCVSCHQSVQ